MKKDVIINIGISSFFIILIIAFCTKVIIGESDALVIFGLLSAFFSLIIGIILKFKDESLSKAFYYGTHYTLISSVLLTIVWFLLIIIIPEFMRKIFPQDEDISILFLLAIIGNFSLGYQIDYFDK